MSERMIGDILLWIFDAKKNGFTKNRRRNKYFLIVLTQEKRNCKQQIKSPDAYLKNTSTPATLPCFDDGRSIPDGH